MTEQIASRTAVPTAQTGRSFSVAAWTRANALGLAITFALFAFVGGTLEALGADHDSVVRNAPALIAMITGGAVFARLRAGVAGHHARLRWRSLIVGGGMAGAFVVGSFAVPLDFVACTLVAGVLAGALQLRSVRRPGPRLLLLSVGSWLVAGLAGIAAAIVVADVFVGGVLGLAHMLDGPTGFVAILALLGAVGGAVGGALEGLALRRHLN